MLRLGRKSSSEACTSRSSHQLAPGYHGLAPGLGPIEATDARPIRAGERVPLDGQVIEGLSSVNEAALTGESVPVPKQPGDSLLAGSVNELGLLLMTVTAAKGQTLLDRMAPPLSPADWLDALDDVRDMQEAALKSMRPQA